MKKIILAVLFSINIVFGLGEMSYKNEEGKRNEL